MFRTTQLPKPPVPAPATGRMLWVVERTVRYTEFLGFVWTPDSRPGAWPPFVQRVRDAFGGGGESL